MGRSPFAAKEFSSKVPSRQRRSTRIDYITPVILTGRDATGQTFREESETRIVNLHGAKVTTNYAIMVGMIVTVEVVRTGQGGKAVCVQVYEPLPGESIHNVAVQLVQPGNIWGVENPPPDWEHVESELGGRHFAAKTPDLKASVVAMKPVVAAPAPPTPVVSRGDSDALYSDLEKRAARLMESVLDILRIQVDGVVRGSLQEVEKQVETMVTAGEVRLQERADQVGVELEMTLESFRTEAMGEVVREALQGFQERLDALSKEAEGRLTRRAEQAMTEFETALKNSQKRQETLMADGDARIKRSSEAAVADFEANLQIAQKREGTKAAEVEAKISRLADQAIAKVEAARQNLQQLEEKLTSEGDSRIKRSSETALADFEAKLKTAQQRQGAQSAEAETKIAHAADKAMADFEAALETFRADVGDELAARREEVVKSTEQVLRTRLAALLSTIMTAPAAEPASPAEPKTKK